MTYIFHNQERKAIARANFLARHLLAQNSPTDSSFAYELWEIVSAHMSPISYLTGKKLYLKAGYEPYKGFPLTHK